MNGLAETVERRKVAAISHLAKTHANRSALLLT